VVGTTVQADEYLTVADLADRLKVAVKTVRNHMYDGTWQRGEHWFSPDGIGPRFSWRAIEQWLRGGDTGPPTTQRSPAIPLARVGGRRRPGADSDAAGDVD
jgi:hypothetical protein